MFPRSSSSLLSASLVSLLALTGCAATAPAEQAPDPGPDTHGAVDGAAELAEPALGLTSIDQAGRVSHLDLFEETWADLGTARVPSAVHSDGRYLFSIDESGVSVVDSGVWTWDHVDHFHYYRAQPRVIGDVVGGGVATVATSNSSTSGGTGLFFPDTGDAVLLDTEALSKGRIEESFRLSREPGRGMVVPVGSFAAVAAASGVTLHAADGAARGDSAECVDPAGTITTRVGAVIGCQDGALLIHVEDDEPVIERIAYPADAPAPPATEFANREGRPRVAALAGGVGIWMLDTRARSWTFLPAPEPLVQVVAVDDADGNVLALTAEGRVLVLDGETGAPRAASAPLVPASLASGASPSLEVDQQRAYLNGPVEQRLWEIDFADDARIAREFAPQGTPLFFAETGR